jgi:hypothetical protein
MGADYFGRSTVDVMNRGGGPDGRGVDVQTETIDAFCRAVEAYLCRRNSGHLIRIAGPSFDRVRGWATSGIPIKVAYRGIDRCIERQQLKGPRRRPVPIDFCEADVLDAFDEWRRALGVPAPVSSGSERDVDPEPARRRREPLPAHLDRVIARLTVARAGASAALDSAIDAAVRELDAARSVAGALRAGARTDFLSRLVAIDQGLVTVAAAGLEADVARAVRLEAEEEVAPYRSRMTPEAYAGAVEASESRIVRDRCRLPVLELS